jgi:hypothetical protein
MSTVNGNAATQDEVFQAVSDEVQYQYDRFGFNPHEIDSFATYIRQYSSELDQLATKGNGPVLKLDAVRKIAALAVRCMEQHGITHRERR